jgi:hypothetical protein
MQENVLLGEARPFGQVEQEYCVASVWFWNCPSGHDEHDVVADSAYCPLPQASHVAMAPEDAALCTWYRPLMQDVQTLLLS